MRRLSIGAAQPVLLPQPGVAGEAVLELRPAVGRRPRQARRVVHALVAGEQPRLRGTRESLIIISVCVGAGSRRAQTLDVTTSA